MDPLLGYIEIGFKPQEDFTVPKTIYMEKDSAAEANIEVGDYLQWDDGGDPRTLFKVVRIFDTFFGNKAYVLLSISNLVNHGRHVYRAHHGLQGDVPGNAGVGTTVEEALADELGRRCALHEDL